MVLPTEVSEGGEIFLGQWSLTEWQNSVDISEPLRKILGGLSTEFLTW